MQILYSGLYQVYSKTKLIDSGSERNCLNILCIAMDTHVHQGIVQYLDSLMYMYMYTRYKPRSKILRGSHTLCHPLILLLQYRCESRLANYQCLVIPMCGLILLIDAVSSDELVRQLEVRDDLVLRRDSLQEQCTSLAK